MAVNHDSSDTLIRLFTDYTGHSPISIDMLPGAGSNRTYYRLTDSDNRTLIGVCGTNREENEAFIYLSRHLKAKNLPVPDVPAVSADNMHYLAEDLGDTSLFGIITHGRQDRDELSMQQIDLLERTIGMLPDLQWLGAEGLDTSRCFPVPTLDRQAVMWDLNYFKYCFLKPAGAEFHEARLEKDMNRLADILLAFDAEIFMYRDFQSRNVMIGPDNAPHFIDYQGGRIGAPHYDVVSFLWQAKARIPDNVRRRLIDTYVTSAKRYDPQMSPEEFYHELQPWILFRMLQVLGTYGFRGLVEGKTHFLQSIPPALDTIRQLIKQNATDGFNELRSALSQVIDKRRFQQHNPNRLIVTVNSFGYRKSGIPRDYSGNGGGFVFDCRAIENPGKYPEYRNLTGLDKPVIDFLETRSDISSFIGEVCAIVDRHVEKWIERGFTSLTVNFGCTGGQHRSVYSAERMARHINEKYGVEVDIHHIEQDIQYRLSPTNNTES